MLSATRLGSAEKSERPPIMGSPKLTVKRNVAIWSKNEP